MNLLKLKRNDKIGLFLFAAFVITTSLIYLFEDRFDKNQWRSNPARRYQMVDDIIESQMLKDKTKDEVLLLLGEPNSSASAEKEVFLYRLGNPPTFFDSKREQLLIVFEDGKVFKVATTLE
jgi:outer membrane protein assembly factor BamE (lipoprotein component of BamABCDE complex)